jgi:hypothetical protein
MIAVETGEKVNAGRAAGRPRDPRLTSERGEALRHLLYLFARDEAIRLLEAGLIPTDVGLPRRLLAGPGHAKSL